MEVSLSRFRVIRPDLYDLLSYVGLKNVMLGSITRAKPLGLSLLTSNYYC